MKLVGQAGVKHAVLFRKCQCARFYSMCFVESILGIVWRKDLVDYCNSSVEMMAVLTKCWQEDEELRIWVTSGRQYSQAILLTRLQEGIGGIEKSWNDSQMSVSHDWVSKRTHIKMGNPRSETIFRDELWVLSNLCRNMFEMLFRSSVSTEFRDHIILTINVRARNITTEFLKLS